MPAPGDIIGNYGNYGNHGNYGAYGAYGALWGWFHFSNHILYITVNHKAGQATSPPVVSGKTSGLTLIVLEKAHNEE
jgi:hypothetical protein